ncbi:MAG: type 1 glutamine amidotransferase domain-containing protein [Candidatus Dormibacteraceae bacterium]
MELEGRKIAILAEDLYEDPELWYPYYRLQEAGATVSIVGSGRKDTFESKHGFPVQADLSIDDARADAFDAVVVPGGYSPDYMRRKPAMIDFVRDLDVQGKPVAAICHAGWVLASAGVLKDRHATGYYSIKDDMVAAGALYEDRSVVVDRNLVTSRRPGDLPDFMRALIGLLAGERAAV